MSGIDFSDSDLANLRSRQKLAYAVVEEIEPATRKEVQERMGCSKFNAQEALRTLLDKGYLEREQITGVGHQHYRYSTVG